MRKYKNAVSCEIIEAKIDRVSVIWWVVWLFLFFPALIFVAVIHFSGGERYRAVVTLSNGKSKTTKWINAGSLSKIKSRVIYNKNRLASR